MPLKSVPLQVVREAIREEATREATQNQDLAIMMKPSSNERASASRELLMALGFDQLPLRGTLTLNTTKMSAEQEVSRV